MKRFIWLILPAVMLPSLLSAQVQPQPSAVAANRSLSIVQAPRSEWLASFRGISINGHMQVKIVRNPKEEGPRITYDTQGEMSTKFKAAVDRNGILRIEEPIDSKRTTVTQVTLWCNDIASLSVTGADLTLESPVVCDMFDLEVAGGANVQAKFDVADLVIIATGRSTIVVEGAAKYLYLDISTAKFDGLDLETVSSVVEASHTSEVMLSVSERLEGTTSTSAKIFYKGSPRILRTHTTLFGGDISAIE